MVYCQLGSSRPYVAVQRRLTLVLRRQWPATAAATSPLALALHGPQVGHGKSIARALALLAAVETGGNQWSPDWQRKLQIDQGEMRTCQGLVETPKRNAAAPVASRAWSAKHRWVCH